MAGFLQDLKPSNIAVNEDCELKVRLCPTISVEICFMFQDLKPSNLAVNEDVELKVILSNLNIMPQTYLCKFVADPGRDWMESIVQTHLRDQCPCYAI